MSLGTVADVQRLLEKHFEALESDFQHYYGIDLRAACYGDERIGMRRLAALTRWLPPGSAIHRAIEPEAAAWGYTDELLLMLVKLVDQLNRLTYAVHAQGHQMPKAIEVRRPWERPETPRVASSTETREFFRGRR